MLAGLPEDVRNNEWLYAVLILPVLLVSGPVLLRGQEGRMGIIRHAQCLDATAYGLFLRNFSSQLGVTRIEGRIAEVRRSGESGDITALALDSGTAVEGDLFIDCTGFRG